MNELDGQVAVITGASSGIGNAIAIRLATLGAQVCIIGRNLSKLKAIKQEHDELSSRILCYEADFLLDRDLKKLSRRLIKDFNRIDILVHSAGLIFLKRLEKSPVEELDKLYSVNVRAPYYLTQKLLPLIRRFHGQIVFMNSSVALRAANSNSSQYTLTKYALRALADSLRDEVNNEGVRVLSIFPGQTATPMQKRAHELLGKKYYPDDLLQPEDIAKVLTDTLILPRTAEITEINIRPFIKTSL